MRQALGEYFRPKDDFFTSLWSTSLISFDASVLLNVYGYSKSTREEISALFDKYKNRLVLPHQFALEYARNRASVIVRQVANCDEAIKQVDKVKNNQIFEAKRDNPHLSAAASGALDIVLGELKESRDELQSLIGADPYAEMILEAFDGCIGQAPDETALAKLHADAKIRFAAKTPPGYADEKAKGIPDAYGDYLGWAQLMELCKSKAKPAILVTDDLKEDWWHLEKSWTILPRPELLKEFRAVTGQDVWIYNSEGFLRDAQKHDEARLSDAALAEITETTLAARHLREMGVLKAEPLEPGDEEKIQPRSSSEKMNPTEKDD